MSHSRTVTATSFGITLCSALATSAMLLSPGPALAQVPYTVSAPQDQQPPAASVARIPVSADVSGTATTAPAGNQVAFDAKGSGTMHGYGAIRFEVKGSLDPAPECPTFAGTETVTVKGGGKLTGHVVGYGCPEVKSPGTLDVQAVNQVAGGTGQFQGAAGGWVVTGTLDTVSGAFSHHLHGIVLVPRGGVALQ